MSETQVFEIDLTIDGKRDPTAPTLFLCYRGEDAPPGPRFFKGVLFALCLSLPIWAAILWLLL